MSAREVTDTIRAALEAAGEAVERVSNGHASRYEAAAAVAAFNARLAERGDHMQMYHAALAALVEEIARDG